MAHPQSQLLRYLSTDLSEFMESKSFAILTRKSECRSSSLQSFGHQMGNTMS